MTVAEKGVVYLVGAGPGDPELLTVRALRLLQTADLVLHDDLVPDALVREAGPRTLVTSVGKRCGRPRVTQARIGTMMVEAARSGQSVVRLKSGDPLIFGRAGEELTALREAGVRVEIVPGITAGLAAGAHLQLPLTDRAWASKLILCTAHYAEADGRPVWEGPVPPDATLVIYMPGRDAGRLQGELRAAGVPARTACCVVSRVGGAEESVIAGRVSRLERMGLGVAPSVVIVGRVVERLLRGEAEMVEAAREFGASLLGE